MKRLIALASGGIALFLGGTLGAQPVATPAAPPSAVHDGTKFVPSDRWYVLMMQGQRAGWMNTTETMREGNLVNASETRLEIKRGPITIKVVMKTEFEETPDGKPLSMSSEQALGAMTTKTRTVFTESGTETTSEVGGQKTVTKGKLPTEPWMTPAAAERHVKSELAKGATEIRIATIDPTVGEGLITVTRKVVGKSEVDVFGRTVPAVQWETSIDKFPGVKQNEYVSESGETLRSVTDMGGIKLEQLAADRDLALSKLDAPELLESTVVKPNRTIDNPRGLQRATYRLRVDEGELPELPSSAGQTFTRESPKAALVTHEAKGFEAVAATDLEEVRSRHLVSSMTLKADDPEIVALLAKAKVDGASPAQAAEKLRRFVHGFIRKKDMSVGFATASEVARTRTGDCTEHAVLLGALLRAAKIPSRCASGLVYVDQFGGQEGIFGYHMWTQALVPGPDGTMGWVNLDATLPDDTAYDAAHVLLSVSALGEGEMQNFIVSMAPLIGRLKIDVVELK